MTGRREFLRGLAALATAACSKPATAPAPAAPPIAVDMHNHVYPAGTEPHPRGPQESAPALAIQDAFQRSGLTAVCAAFVLDFAKNEKPGDARTNYLAWLDAVDAVLAAGNVKRALAWSDVVAAHAEQRSVIIQSVEGAHFIEGDLSRIEEVYERGVRHLQLLHDKDDMVKPLGDVIMAPPHLGGLSAFGRDVVKECNRIGMLVDLAHGTPDTVAGALAASSQPIIVSHTNLDTWRGVSGRMADMMKPRMITKEHAKAVADAGGVVGVWTKLANSPAEYADSLKAMVDAIGIDHVGIGTDTDLLSTREGQGTTRVWSDGAFFVNVSAELARHGLSADDIAKVAGGNYGRVFAKATAR